MSLSCSRYQEVETLPLERKQITLDVDSSTRAYFENLGSAYRHYWESGDCLSVFYGNTTNACFTLKSGAGTQSATFEGEAVAGAQSLIYALYPYSANSALSGSNLVVDFPAKQSVRLDKPSYDRQGFVMAACGTEGNLKMTNLSAVIALSVKGSATITKVELKATSGQYLAGRANVEFKNSEPQTSIDNGSTVVSLECDCTLSDKASELFIAVAPTLLQNGFEVTLYDNAGMSMTRRHSSAVELRRNRVYRMPEFTYTATDRVVVADLLDLVFNSDTTASDVSPMNMGVVSYPSTALSVFYDDVQGINVARFNHNISTSVTEGYYSISYADNDRFKSAIADGFAMECLMMPAVDMPSGEVKFFSGQDAAGFGLIVNSQANGGDIVFMPNFTTNGSAAYHKATSGVIPKRNNYYHIIGVWDKASEKIHIYIDGKLCGTTSVAGAELTICADKDGQRVCVGADTGSGKGERAFNGTVLIARLYNTPLTASDVTTLYERSKRDRTTSGIVLQGVKYAAEARVNEGYRYTIYGYGFESGDGVTLRSGAREYKCTTSLYADCVTFVVPQIDSGKYDVVITRGSDSLNVGDVDLVVDDIPRADMLDVVFNADCSATDVSAKMMYVEYSPSADLTTFYENYQGCYMARFAHTLYSNITSGFYKINFQSNESFRAELADGHTMETIVRLNTNHDGSDEAKWFSCHDTGGTGFLLTKSDRGGGITFLPRVGSDYAWATSSVKPKVGQYYHIVGVWNKSLGRATVYVDGVKYGSVTTSGEFVQPKNDTSCWFAIGGDARKTVPSSPQNSWNGDVAMARIYDAPLTDEQVAKLWNEAKRDRVTSAINLTNIEHFSGAEVKAGSRYSVYATGLKSGDRLEFKPSSAVTVSQPQCSFEGDRIVATIPQDMVSGVYGLYVVRGQDNNFIGNVEFTVTDNPRKYVAPQIIAHRGVCNNGEPDNSMASFKSAQNIGGIYGTEFDIYTTSDGVIVLNHDKTTDKSGLVIENSTYAQIMSETLSNGEPLPTLEAILEQSKSTPNLRLIVEVKKHNSTANTIACTQRAIDLIKSKGFEDRVDFISFSYDACKLAAQLLPNITVGYLSSTSDKTPEQVWNDGINNIDYKWSSLKNRPQYIEQAHNLSMTVNAWTVNDLASMLDIYQSGVDFLSTDQVAIAKSLYAKPFVEHP